MILYLINIFFCWFQNSKSKRKASKPNGDVTDNGGVEGHIAVSMKTVAAEEAVAKDMAVIQFSSPTAVVLENAGKVELMVERFGRLDHEAKCLVETLDRTAKGDVDYVPVKELVTFEPDERSKKVIVSIIDDKNWNLDKVFLVKLSIPDDQVDNSVAKGRLCMMTVTIVDDDEPGVIAFGQRLVTVGEGAGKVIVPVLREQGADGELRVKYKTADGTAKSGMCMMVF